MPVSLRQRGLLSSVAVALVVIIAVALQLRTAHASPPLPTIVRDVSAAYALLERFLPGSSAAFTLATTGDAECGVGVPAPCLTIADGGAGKVTVTGSGVSEVTAALGVYFRQVCNMTIGWPRGGGSRVFTPSPWPSVGTVVSGACACVLAALHACLLAFD